MLEDFFARSGGVQVNKTLGVIRIGRIDGDLLFKEVFIGELIELRPRQGDEHDLTIADCVRVRGSLSLRTKLLYQRVQRRWPSRITDGNRMACLEKEFRYGRSNMACA